MCSRYHHQGLRAFEICTQFSHSVRLYTVLRNPIEKFLSGVYFWKRAVPSDLQEKLQDPATITVDDIDALVNKVFNFGQPNVGRAGAIFQYHYVLSQLPAERRDYPTDEDTQVACDAVSRDFTVGVTEDMDSFIVLIALENNWPLEEMCYFPSHVNKERPTRSAFTPQVNSHLETIFAKESKIVECARQTHLKQGARFSNFSKAVELFKSAEFKQRCEAIKKHYVKSDGFLSKEEIRARNRCTLTKNETEISQSFSKEE
mmetsp:Transcript_14966/g.19417  ORF Transcript_14966/g.19417 Transcript_14966/m.19417 type:complete len:259 (-) Transcript_14966:266-1042(-)